MKFTPAQIAKLTPEQKRARNKRLAYNREYDAAKKKGKKPQDRKSTVRSIQSKRTVIVKATAKLETSNDRIQQLEASLAELRTLTERESEVLAEMKALLE